MLGLARCSLTMSYIKLSEVLGENGVGIYVHPQISDLVAVKKFKDSARHISFLVVIVHQVHISLGIVK